MRRFAIVLAAAFITTSAFAGSKKDTNALVVSLMEQSGIAYTKLTDGVWSIPFEGQTVKDIELRVATSDDLVVVLSVLAERKDLQATPRCLTTMLEYNSEVDGAKVVLSEDQVLVRYDAKAKTLDKEEWNYVTNQVASAVDEVVPKLKGCFK